MDPQLPMAPEDYPSSMGYKPLPFLGLGAVAVMSQTIPWFCPLSGYDYFVDPPLPRCDHPNEWVETKGKEMSNSGTRAPFRPSFNVDFAWVWKMMLAKESIVGESPIATLLHDYDRQWSHGNISFLRRLSLVYGRQQGHALHILATRLLESFWSHFRDGRRLCGDSGLELQVAVGLGAF